MLANDLPTGATFPVGLPALSALNADALIAHARTGGEPAWLQERRAAAWTNYTTAPMPLWRRTDLSKLQLDPIVPVSDATSTTVQWDDSLAAQGVVFTTLKRALATHGDLIERYL